MKNTTKLLLLGIPLLLILIYWNNEVFEHRMHMKEAKHAYKMEKYDYAIYHLQKAGDFPFHEKAQAYIKVVEMKKEEAIKAKLTRMAKEADELKMYKEWVESNILAPISSAYQNPNIQYGKNSNHMRDLMYELNFTLQNKQIHLDESYLSIHEKLTDYVNKNQLAYTSWSEGKKVQGDVYRQEAVKAHTEFLITFENYAKEKCSTKIKISDHFY